MAAAANGAACCGGATGPGYATPLEAMEKGPREKLLYVTCVYNGKRRFLSQHSGHIIPLATWSNGDVCDSALLVPHRSWGV